MTDDDNFKGYTCEHFEHQCWMCPFSKDGFDENGNTVYYCTYDDEG